MAEGLADQSFASRVADAEAALRRMRPHFLNALAAEWRGFMPVFEQWLLAADEDASTVHRRLLNIVHNAKGQAGTIGLQDVTDAARVLWDLLNQCERGNREGMLVLRAHAIGVQQGIDRHLARLSEPA